MKTVSIDWNCDADPISDQLTKQGMKYEVGIIDVLEENVSNCTRSSKLWSTNSGIIMLENKILYLLNTK
jgi:hypothetical protein